MSAVLVRRWRWRLGTGESGQHPSSCRHKRRSATRTSQTRRLGTRRYRDLLLFITNLLREFHVARQIQHGSVRVSTWHVVGRRRLESVRPDRDHTGSSSSRSRRLRGRRAALVTETSAAPRLTQLRVARRRLVVVVVGQLVAIVRRLLDEEGELGPTTRPTVPRRPGSLELKSHVLVRTIRRLHFQCFDLLASLLSLSLLDKVSWLQVLVRTCSRQSSATIVADMSTINAVIPLLVGSRSSLARLFQRRFLFVGHFRRRHIYHTKNNAQHMYHNKKARLSLTTCMLLYAARHM